MRLDRPDRQHGDGARGGGVAGLLPGHCGERLHGYCVLTMESPQHRATSFSMPGSRRDGETGPRCITEAGRLDLPRGAGAGQPLCQRARFGGSGAGTAGDHRPARRARLRRGAVRHPEDRRRRSDGQPGAQARRDRSISSSTAAPSWRWWPRIGPRRSAPRPARRPTRRRCWSWAAREWASRLAAAPDDLAELSHPPGRRRRSGSSPAAPPDGPRPRCSRTAPSSTPRSATPARCSATPRTTSPSRCRSSTSATRWAPISSSPSPPAPPACCSTTAAPPRSSSAGSRGTGRPS